MASGEVDMGNPFGAAYNAEEDFSPELEAIKQSIDSLPKETGDRLRSMFSCNGLTLADLDVKSVMELARLHLTLQAKVLQHMENERVFLCNSRSKSRFLISTCERAKQGALDVRGFGAIDPWKSHLNAIAVTAPRSIDLMKEAEYAQLLGPDAVVSFEIDIKVCPCLVAGNESGIMPLVMPLGATAGDLKDKIMELGCTLDQSIMKLRVTGNDPVKAAPVLQNINELGFLRPQYTFAFYNMPPDRPVKLLMVRKQRGGTKYRKDFSQSTKHPDSRPSLLAAKIGPMPMAPAMMPMNLKGPPMMMPMRPPGA